MLVPERPYCQVIYGVVIDVRGGHIDGEMLEFDLRDVDCQMIAEYVACVGIALAWNRKKKQNQELRDKGNMESQ